MNKGTRRLSVKDRAKERRKYLRKRAEGQLAWILIPVALTMLLFAATASIVLLRDLATDADRPLAHTPYDRQYDLLFPLERWPLSNVVLILVTGVIGLKVLIRANEQLVDGADLPYVPTVTEQIAALSADEILLRGSDEPAIGPEELLRAARAGTAEQAEELLRADVQVNGRTTI
jgi:hypothetical protein